jgi:hypothetical protein
MIETLTPGFMRRINSRQSGDMARPPVLVSFPPTHSMVTERTIGSGRWAIAAESDFNGCCLSPAALSLPSAPLTKMWLLSMALAFEKPKTHNRAIKAASGGVRRMLE